MIAVTTPRIGQRVMDARKARDWSQSDLARRSGLSPSYISRLESGEFTRPSHENLDAIARSFGLRVADLTDPPADPADDDLRRAIVDRLGPDRAEHALAILSRMRGKSLDDLEKVVEITRVLLD